MCGEGNWGARQLKFEMFLFYSLSAQFVLVEGFKKLKLKDARVQKPFKAHIGHLKMVRHATYHFVHEERPSPREMFGQLNSAEELHDALGKHIREVVKHKAQIERFLEIRVKPRNWSTRIPPANKPLGRRALLTCRGTLALEPKILRLPQCYCRASG